MTTLVVNKLRGGHQIAGSKAPGFGSYRTEVAKDIAAIVGAQVVPADMVEDINEKYVDQLFGEAKAIKSEAMSTIIMGGKRNKDEVDKRLGGIEEKIEKGGITKFEIEKLEQRKAKLGGGVAVINVGAKSEIDMKELKDRVDDAKEAVIAAMEEGTVIGGGCALLAAMNKAYKETLDASNDISFGKGDDIVIKAIEAPFRTICENANVSGDVKLEGVLSRPTGTGYNAKTDEYVKMYDEGILDPKKVTRIALESAASVAGTILTTQCALMDVE